MIKFLWADPSRYSYSPARSMKHEVDLISAAMKSWDQDTSPPPSSFPRYNVYKKPDRGPGTFFMEFELVGYDKASLDAKMDNGHLVISGKTSSEGRGDWEIIRQGVLIQGDFSSRFYVGKDTEVRGAKFANGLLTIELERRSPEEQKARSISIL